MPNITPNRYGLQSNDGKTKVVYETSTFSGQESFNLALPPGHPIRHFSGSQIRAVSTGIGTLVTVTTGMTTDTGSTSFSVLIPAITLATTSDHQKFSTEAMVTSHSGPNSKPSTGVHETYEFIPMTGQASFVVALIEPLLGNQETTIEGCLRAGVEKGCIILVTADKKEYSLHGKDLPTLGKGLGVQVRGKAGGVDTCLQGTPFAVESWTWTRERCPE